MSDQKVARGQRVIDEVEIVDARDGKQKARSAKAHKGALGPQLSTDPKAQPSTTEDVVDVTKTPSSWEAVETDGRKAGRGGKTPQ